MNGLIKTAALAALLVSTAAMAQQEPATAGQGGDFKSLDVNGDGSLSQDEAKADTSLAAEFSKLDADKDGKLSSSEYAKAKGKGEKKEY